MPGQAVVFPGQGSQRQGMALDFAEKFQEAREVFIAASKVLPFDLIKTCRSDQRQLDFTEYTQPCILSAEIAIFEVLKRRFGFSPDYFGGHSLGEYSALVAAEVIPFEIALQLVHQRGKLMQRAVEPGVGGMVAVKMRQLSLLALRGLAKKAKVDIANDNSPEQVVLSGIKSDIEKFTEVVNAYQGQGIGIVPLTVSEPFHSRYMATIEGEFRMELEEKANEFRVKRATKVLSNYTGKFHTDKLSDLLHTLTRQISGTVRWRDNMMLLAKVAEQIIEVGPNRPLQAFFQTIGVEVPAVISVRSARRTFQPNDILNDNL